MNESNNTASPTTGKLQYWLITATVVLAIAFIAAVAQTAVQHHTDRTLVSNLAVGLLRAAAAIGIYAYGSNRRRNRTSH